MSSLVLCVILLSVMVSAQPQYRVHLDPPVDVVSIPPGVTDLQLTLCFRERDPSSATLEDRDYCPLGTVTLPANGPDLPPQTLQLGSRADSLPSQYQLATIAGGVIGGLGLLVIVNGVSGGTTQQLSFIIANRVGGVPGELDNVTGTTSGAGRFTVRFAVTCLPEFTGDMCTTPTTPTESPTTTTKEVIIETTTIEEVTTETATIEEVTMETTTTEEETTGTTIMVGVTMEDAFASGLSGPSLGVGFIIGFITATLIALTMVTAVSCFHHKRQKRRGPVEEGRFEMKSNPVYVSHHITTANTNDDDYDYTN